MSEPANIIEARKLIREFEKRKKPVQFESPYDLMLQRLQPAVLPCPFCGETGLIWGAGQKGRVRWEVKCAGIIPCEVKPYINDWTGYAQTQSALIELRGEKLIQLWNKRA